MATRKMARRRRQGCHSVAILMPSCCHLVAILLASCCYLPSFRLPSCSPADVTICGVLHCTDCYITYYYVYHCRLYNRRYHILPSRCHPVTILLPSCCHLVAILMPWSPLISFGLLWSSLVSSLSGVITQVQISRVWCPLVSSFRLLTVRATLPRSMSRVWFPLVRDFTSLVSVGT